jgi:hypothetical protein
VQQVAIPFIETCTRGVLEDCDMPLFRRHWLKLGSVQESSVRLPRNGGLATAAILAGSE